MKSSIYFIVNPNSGTSKKERLRDTIDQYLDHNKYDYTYRETQYAGHASVLAAEAKNQNVDILAVCGGDGTINEVIQKLVHTHIALGIIPGGSGNGFAGHLGITRDFKKAITILNEARIDTIDTCKVNNKIFVNVAGIGFDGLVSYRSKNNTQRGLWMYLKTAFNEMIQYNPPKIQVIVDGEDHTGQYATVAIANASMYGYSFTLAHDARLKDGILDIIMIKKVPLWIYLMNAYRFLFKSLHKSKHVIVKKAKSIEIKSEEAQYYHIDGEGFKTEEKLNFQIIPNSLNVIYNKTAQL